MVRSRDEDDNSDFAKQMRKPALQVKLENIDPGLGNDEIDVRTCISGAVYEWTFRLKEGSAAASRGGSKEVLCKLKLEKNLTTGEKVTDEAVAAAEAPSSKVSWRFKLAPG
mmetsp:Transcript_31911/g.37553  ORF Transcript_31911/g.37553 Transcript_31911/m.37553 type:complete len:111 (-) Transcript_31911:126-458(-)